jgi:hypothetical protein
LPKLSIIVPENNLVLFAIRFRQFGRRECKRYRKCLKNFSKAISVLLLDAEFRVCCHASVDVRQAAIGCSCPEAIHQDKEVLRQTVIIREYSINAKLKLRDWSKLIINTVIVLFLMILKWKK